MNLNFPVSKFCAVLYKSIKFDYDIVCIFFFLNLSDGS